MNRHAMLRMAAMIPLAMACAACAGLGSSDLPERPAARIDAPENRLTVREEPLAPDLPAIDWTSTGTARRIVLDRDEATLDYILDLREWGGQCYADIAGLKAARASVAGD